MIAALERIRGREAVFAAAAVTIWVSARAILGAAPGAEERRALEIAVTVDLTVTLTALWYLLVVRGRGWPALTTAPVFLASTGIAGLVLPEGRQGALEAFHWLAIPVELLLLGTIAVRARRARTSFRRSAGDLYDRIRVAARSVAPGRAADAMAYEVAILVHAFARRLSPVEPGPGERAITSHRTAAYGTVVLGLGIVVAVEAVAVHFLLRMWSPTAAWVLTGLSIYSVVWLVGDWRAIRARPSVVGRGLLRLRLGIRWEVDVPRAAIESVEPGLVEDADLKLTLPAAKGVTLRLHEPVEAIGPYGIRRRARSIALALDDPDAASLL